MGSPAPGLMRARRNRASTGESVMKTWTLAVLLTVGPSLALACESIGWRLVEQKQISVTERLCVWEKNRVRTSRIVSGLCPLDPC